MLRPQLKKQDAEIGKLQKEVATAADAWHKIEDKTFAQFCKKIKVNNIRVYEEQQGGLAKESAQKRNEYSRQISKLQTQLSFEQGRLQDIVDRIKKLAAGITRDKSLLVELESEKVQVEEEIQQTGQELRELKATHQKTKNPFAHSRG